MKRGWLSGFAVVAALFAGCGSQAVDYGNGGGGDASTGAAICRTNAECTGFCNTTAGLCQACASNTQCTDPARPNCVGGACTGGCGPTAPCTGGKACINGQCGACQTTAQCSGGQACVSGVCQACAADAQCGPGMTCSLGVCSGPDGGGIIDGGGGDACTGSYAGSVGPVGSIWGNATNGTPPGFGNGQTSLTAGNTQCTTAYPPAAHVCTWEELKALDTCGALATLKTLPPPATAWMYRTAAETALSDDNPTAPAALPTKAGRCNDFTYGTNHAYDGEFIEFTGTALKGHFDSDQGDDGPLPGGGASPHAAAGVLDCNGASRLVLCCK